MNNYKTLINNRIAKLRKEKGLTQEQFSEIAHISTDGLRKLEQNKYAPKSDTIDKICKAFNITPFDLLVEPLSGGSKSMADAIYKKLQLCNEQELRKIDAMIDIIRG